MIDIKHLAKYHAALNIPLTYEEAYELGCYAIKGCEGDRLAQVQSISLLTALHNKALYRWKWNNKQSKVHGHRLPEDAAEQIAGICAAVFDEDIRKSEFGFVDPDVSYAMDNCGMGGDLILTANLSTIAGFIAAAAGIPMCKHGSPANAGQCGSSDFVSAVCGIDNFAGKSRIEKSIEENNFGYIEACDTRFKKIHMQTHEVAQLPHMNDIIGPVTNPLNPKKMTRRILGVNHLIPLGVVARAYRIMNEKGVTNLEHGLFIRGFAAKDRRAGMDEISICPGGTQVAELRSGGILEYEVYANDFGVDTVTHDDVVPVGDKGSYSLSILKGEVNGARLNVALANTAPLFYLAGSASDLKEGFKMARDVHSSGKGYKNMLSVKEFH